jgi:Fic family protein
MTDEPVARIEPCHLDDPGPEVMNVLAKLVEATVSLGSRLHPRTAASLADLVRIMNTYYSNLIEGHNTRPREIEQALLEQIDAQGERRNTKSH